MFSVDNSPSLDLFSAVTKRFPFWANVADGAVVWLVALWLRVLVIGGFVFRIAGTKISIQSAWRPLAWAVVIATVRHVIARRPWLGARLVSGTRAVLAAIRRLPESDGFALRSAGAPRSRFERLLINAAVFLLFAALTAAMTYPQVRFLGTRVSVETGDPLLSTWRLAWVAHQITRDPLHLFDANIFYPTRFTLAFSDAMLVPALAAAPLFWAGVPQLVVYNVVFLSAFALSGFCMFLLVRSLTADAAAAFVAGFVFAFLPYRFMHYAHLELQFSWWMPLCLAAVHRALRTGRVRDGVAAGVILALQALSSLYYAIFFATVLAPFVLTLAIRDRGHVRRRLWPLAVGVAVAAAIIAPVTVPYFAAQKSVGRRPLWEIQFYSATPQDYFVAHSSNALYGPLTAQYGHQERELFQGVVVPVLALIALWPPLSATRLAYGVAGLLAFDVSLGFHGLSYPWLHLFVLPYQGLRVPARMGMLVGMALSVLMGFGVARLRARRSAGVALAIPIGIMLLIFAEYRPTVALSKAWSPAGPPVYQHLAADPDAVLLELPLKTPDIYLEPVYMYFSTFHWHRLVNGYSGFSPASYSQLLGRMRKFPDADSIEELRRRDVDYVILHGDLFDQVDDYRVAVQRIEADPNFELVGLYPWHGSDTRLYRMVRATSTAAPSSPPLLP